MLWIVKIENKPEFRIEITFDPLNELLIFNGQYKLHSKWTTFNTVGHSINIDLNKITEIVLTVYDKLESLVNTYNNIAEGFQYIKEIEIKPINSIEN